MGPKAYNWKGEDASYYAIHSWVRNRLGKPFMCEECGKDDKNIKYEWSNIDGEYKRDLNDYIMLCISCHRKRDNLLKIRQKKDITTSLKAAQLFASRSYAKRLKVGAVLLQQGHIISNGRNGTPSGRNNNCEILVKTRDEPFSEWITKPEVLHAEANAIMFAARKGISTEGSTLVTTHSPCFECCKLIIQSGVKNVYYDEEYRDLSGIKLLKECNVETERI